MVNRPKHTGLTLIGVYLSNFFNFVFLFFGTYGLINEIYYLFFYSYGYYDPYSEILAILFFYFLFNLFLLNKFSRFKNLNYTLVGLMNFVPSLIIGGLFILIDGNRSIKTALPSSSSNGINFSLESKLKEIDNLFERRIITKEEYDLKRKDIISRY
jgi:hypothetical protein